MKFYQEETGLYIEICNDVFDHIRHHAEKGYPNENGGILVGKYSDDKQTVYIEHVIIPVAKKLGRTSFIRDATGLEKKWQRLSALGLRYVGEWHSHPNGSSHYSSTDLLAMAEIEKEINIKNPLLLIVSVRRRKLQSYSFYFYNNNKLLTYKKMINLKDLFGGLQKEMLLYLENNRNFIDHSGSKGSATEVAWIKFLKKYLPSRYEVDSAFVIDSFGNISQQIDIVIYDTMYTPFIFNKENCKYIPAEGVYAVFEVKQNIYGHLDYAAKKIESVRKLKRTSMDMVASGNRTSARCLTKIIGGILTTTSTYKQTKTIEDKLRNLRGYQTIDIGCICDSGSFFVDYSEEIPNCIDPALNIQKNREYIEYVYASRHVNKIKFSDKGVSLFTFFLQLVSYLKAIGTVPAIDINAYLSSINEEIDITL